MDHLDRPEAGTPTVKTVRGGILEPSLVRFGSIERSEVGMNPITEDQLLQDVFPSGVHQSEVVAD
jgi:hypothetical protein